jgi:NADH dehydrogenase
MEQTRIVIIGGGFAGIAAALSLERKRLPSTKITLISDKPHFEYHAALYRLVSGSSPLEVCIPLREVFFNKEVEVIEDKIIAIDKTAQCASGISGSCYQYDHLVLALGSETNYFGIPGLKEFSYGMKSITEALRLKQHIAETLLTCKIDFANKVEQICDANFVVIGAGATGVEMAGQLIVYARKMAADYGIDPSLISVELIEGAPKILPALPKKFTDRIEHHLRGLGVNIFLNRSIEREECEEVYLKDMRMKARTVIWTAGVRANALYETLGFPIDKRGKVAVDKHLRTRDDAKIFIAGDGAATPYSGWAQTAFYDGRYIADVIAATIKKRSFPVYAAEAPLNAIPAGPEWAGVLLGGFHIYGKLGWWLRRMEDLRVFASILPFGKALDVFRSGRSICETCSVCSVETTHSHV